MKKTNLTFLILFLLFISAKFYSQKNGRNSAVADSLEGFNFRGAMEHANEMKTDKEKAFFLNHAKRTYKIAKYNLYPQKNQNGYSSNEKVIGSSTYQGPQPAGCANIDFESGNTSNWTVTGDNSIVTSGVDPYGGFPKVFPGGTASLKLNDDNTSGSKTTFSAQATRVIPVTAANSQFQLHFAFVLLNFPHPANAAANFNVYFLNSSNTTVSCPQFSCYYATPPGTLVGMPAGVAQTGPNGVNIGNQSYPTTYVPWQTIAMDLTPYIGQNLTAVIKCNWCLYNYDWAYCYIDADCAPITPSTSAICPGGQLCGPSGMYGYTWTPPSGPVVTTSCITANVVGTYTLSYTPFSSCGPSIQTNTYQVLPKPTAAFTTANSCNSFTITNTGTGPPAVQSYSFVGPSPPATFTTTSATSVVSFPTPGNYTITQTITNSAGCASTVQAVVVVPSGPNPAFTIPTPTQCLVGNSYVFTAVQAATTHTFSFNPVVGSPPSSNANPYGPVSFTAPGNYTVTHTISNAGCTVSTSSVITISPMPTVTANNNGPICVGGSVSFTSSGGGTYSWSGPAGYSSAVQNPTIAGITMANAGTYTVTVNLAGCLGTATTQVTISTPTASTNNTGPYCAGQTISLIGSAGLTYTWTGPSAFNSNAQSPTIANSTPAMSGNYNFTVNVGGCFATGSTPVVVNALPLPAANNTGPYCPGNTIQLNVGAFTTYTWTGPSAFSSNLQNPTQANAQATNAGVYTVSVSDANGCKNTATTNVVVNPNPVVVIGSNSPVCLNSPINLTSSGGTGYSWSGPNAFSSVSQNPTITPATAVNAGIYTVTVTSAAGCINTGTVSVTVLSPTTTATNTGPYCAGTTIQLNTQAATSYTWAGPAGFTSALQNPTITNASLAMAGTYSVLVSAGACTAFATTNVVVNANPVPAANNTGPYCPGNTIQLNVGAFTTYTWTGPSAFSSNLQNPTQANAQATNAGVYTVSVSDANGCKNTATTNVVVNPNPVVVIGSNSPVCLNNAINLTSSGGTGYSWSGPNAFSSVSQNPTITPAAAVNAGIYTVTVTALGCTNTGTVSVTVLSPTTTASNTGPYCAGATIQLNTPAATSYTWTGPSAYISNAQNPTIANAAVGMSGTYSVLVSAGACTAFATTNVIVNALPVPLANSNSPICVGTPLNFTGSAATTYTWTGPNVFTSNAQNPTIPSASTTASGTYTFAVTDGNNCTNSVTTVVVVNANPVIAVNNPTVCLNTTINLTSNGGSGYSWSGPNSFASAVQNPSIPNAQMNMSGAYTVTVTSAQGCTNTAVANVSVLSLPSPTINSNSPVCVGGQLTLNGSGGATYQWNGPNNFNNTNQNTGINPVTMNANGTYTLIATVGTCTANTTAVIVINPLPVPNIITNSPICIGKDINLSATGGTAFAWAGPNSFAGANQTETITAAGMANAGSYTVVVTDANGCVNFTTANVVVNPQPIVNAAGATVCQNANAQLSSNGGVTYAWSGPGGFASGLQNPTIFNAGPASAGQYTVFITNANTCTNTAVATLIVNPAPVPTINSNSPICMNDVLSLSATGGINYQWTGPNGFTSSVQSPTVMGTSVSVGGIYNVLVTNANSCSATATINTVVNPLPVPQISSGPNAGCAPLCVTYTVHSTPTASLAYWTMGNGESANGVLNSQGCYNSAGVYTITSTVTDIHGCIGQATYTTEVYPKPVADFNHSPIKPVINIDGEVVFTDASYGATITNWNWYFMNSAQYTSTQQNPTFLYTDPGTYVVALVVKSDKGCIDTLLRPLVVGEDYGLYVPNAFTPNSDGFNDVFQPKGFGVVKYELYIFDRWGEKLFHTKTFEESWDGTYQGRGNKLCEESVYTWLINVTDVFGKAHELKGHVTLIR